MKSLCVCLLLYSVFTTIAMFNHSSSYNPDPDTIRQDLAWAFGENWRTVSFTSIIPVWNFHHPNSQLLQTDNLHQLLYKIYESKQSN